MTVSISDEAKKRFPYDYAREGDRFTAQQAFTEGAEWALAEVLRIAEENRVIMKEVHRGYTVENFSDPLVRIADIRILTKDD